jgi:hypothetical protein
MLGYSSDEQGDVFVPVHLLIGYEQAQKVFEAVQQIAQLLHG